MTENFVQVFLWHLMKKPKWTFWPTHCVCVCVCMWVHAHALNHIWFFVTPWTVDPRFLCPWDFPSKNIEHWLPFPTPGDLPNPGIDPTSLVSPALTGRLLNYYATWEAQLPGSSLGRIQGVPSGWTASAREREKTRKTSLDRTQSARERERKRERGRVTRQGVQSPAGSGSALFFTVAFIPYVSTSLSGR